MALDDDDKKVVQDLIADAFKGDDLKKLITGQVTGALKSLKLDEQIGQAIGKALDERTPKEEPPPKEGDPGKGGDEKTAKLERQLEALNQRLASEQEARKAAEEARKAERLETSVRDALIKQGVPADRVRHAIALLKVEGRLGFTEDDRPALKIKGEYGSEEFVAAEEAAAAWVQTDDGKLYLPPRGSQGTGDGAGSRPSKLPRAKDGTADWSALRHKVVEGVLRSDALD